MRDPIRLVDDSKSELVRLVLGAAERDRPLEGASDRAIAALGFASPVVVAHLSPLAGGSGLVASPVVHAASSAAAKTGAVKGAALALAKWPLLAVLGAAAVGTAEYVRAPPPRAAVVPAHAAVVPAHAAVPPVHVGTPAQVSPREAAPPSVEAEPAVEVAPPTRVEQPRASFASRAVPHPEAKSVVPGSDPVVTPPPATPSVMEQLEALRAIRADVDSGDAARALARIDAFNASYAGSPLAEEVLVLRIDALSRAERKAEAAALATSFLQRFPTSAYGTRVRAIAFQ